MPAYCQLVQKLGEGGGEHRAMVIDAAKPYLVAALHQELCLPMLWVVPSPEDAKKFYEHLLVWCSSQTRIMWFPEPDTLPYEPLAPNLSTAQQRLLVLSSLKEAGAEALLIIASATAVVRKTIPYGEFVAACHTLRQGMHLNPLELLARWSSMGYQRENLVEVPGTMSQRGGILDIYPPNSELPARIEFCGNEIDSIRLFDPQSQRSLKPVESITLVPAQEAAWPNTDTIIDYLPPNSLLILDEPRDIEASIGELDVQASELRQSQREKGELPEDSPLPYLTYPELRAKLESVKQRLTLTRWSTENNVLWLVFALAPSYGGQLKLFLSEVKRLLQEGRRVIITSHQASRLSELLREENIFASPLSYIEHPPPAGSLALVQGSLSEGWVMGEDSVLLTDAEIFGFVKQRRLIKPRPVHRKRFLPELSPGDYAVHVEHGIARFAGMTKLRLDEVEREYLTLEYAAGDRLYVPTDQADCVSCYIGSGEPPALSRLGTQEWTRIKQRVEESAREMAQELLTIYAAREVIPGFTFSPDTPWQQDLEASFPYIETLDQMEAVRQVKEDMEKSKPMDRLVCGDVGYGKTEVALRAAFKTVMDGKQVAMLVPTTVLAQQHFTTFGQRLAAFPLRVEMLSRFRSEKEQQAILGGLGKGSVDICIGTHRLLQKDVAFKDLGLVIIDEEQRFGVAHKERLRQMRKEVDVLTLSATPIPRTLHMSLVGVRDMSTMETPPEERLPIKTNVAEYNEPLIREAIIRELERNGQVFFVHNRVQSIARVARKLGELVPEAKIAIGHGQMREEKLERTMLDFTQGKTDVLVCTTIIESGLDIPNVNTLIVNEADKLGLAQLYQLRGRVGRGSNRAYAYFLYSKGKRLTPTAGKRLQTIFEATELGAGFRIAMKDLEIRGAGNLLGPEQSGYITSVGFDLYCQLLAEAVEELKAKQLGKDRASISLAPLPLPTIDLPLSAYIPDDYVADPTTRLLLYQRLAKIGSPGEVERIAEEFKDRFGDLPQVVKNLLYIVNIKALAAQAG
ncbi:MAG TPA: transcription-repair coupling factor, partial [Dehalococcoidia bacterium]|nr:transcription-repair coupling factor [Dehalococcoidia bacterium]